jgi:nitroimidazol reductase NimA-like FMN-containing flavoprotein (pyridoxamine 5'-phosphate oxidase superfamily)
MSASDFAAIQGIEMSDESIDEFLRERGVGVLSLASEGEAYGVPVSFGYDGDNLYFVYLRVGEASRKEEFTDRTERASFNAFEVRDKHRWRSVVVSGLIRPAADDEWGALVSAMEDNAWFPSLFSEAEPMRDILGFVLEIDAATGLRSD